MPTFNPGDRVAYSRNFVKGPGGCLKDIADRRATVEKLVYPVRGSADKGFYRVVWDDSPNEGSIILSTNLVHAGRLHLEQV
jgi:hypothetical protein